MPRATVARSQPAPGLTACQRAGSAGRTTRAPFTTGAGLSASRLERASMSGSRPSRSTSRGRRGDQWCGSRVSKDLVRVCARNERSSAKLAVRCCSRNRAGRGQCRDQLDRDDCFDRGRGHPRPQGPAASCLPVGRTPWNWRFVACSDREHAAVPGQRRCLRKSLSVHRGFWRPRRSWLGRRHGNCTSP